MTYAERHAALERRFHEIERMILARQNPITGLLPASTAVNEHGDYTDAWVRDNVYSVLAVWGLALAYRKIDEAEGRTFVLEAATVRVMRGLLRAMMQQAPKVEAFKASQHPLDALHAKYATTTGEPVVPDDGWGHLQLDATGLFLLMLAQMTASGLAIVASLDEVNFIQNLVYYIGRAYRTPDYGIWERGDKTNHGEPELNASSVAMCKAALEALAGFNLFGPRGGQASVVHVLPDEIARARITLESLLPRESSSKEVDAALLSAVSFPAFAIEDPALVDATRDAIVSKLSGRYGLKRFLRDGHQTVLEDPHRLHYEPHELRQFAHIESEWPLFFAYLALDGLFRGDRAQARHYLERLDEVAVEAPDGDRLLPELYFVPAEAVAAERRAPGSQPRLPNANVPLVWAQSLWLLARMLDEELLDAADLDPLGRRSAGTALRRPVVQLALVAEDADLRDELAERGVRAQALDELAPMRVCGAAELAEAYARLGRNAKLALGGRPLRRLHALTTARIYRLRGERVACLPAFFDRREFYLTLDPQVLLSRLKSELAYLHRHWSLPGRPTMTLLLTRDLVRSGGEAFYAFMDDLRRGELPVPVQLGPLEQLAHTANEERIDELHDFSFAERPPLPARNRRRLRVAPGGHTPLTPEEELAIELERSGEALRRRLARSTDLFEQVELLAALARLEGAAADTGIGRVDELLEDVYEAAGELRLWGVVRRAAGLLEKVDVMLSDALSDLLVMQKHILIGKAYSEASLITRPLPQAELLERLRAFTREDIRDRVLSQELLVFLSGLVRAEPELFRGMLTIRIGHLILLLTSDLADAEDVTHDEAYERLMRLAPSEVERRLRAVLGDYRDSNARLRRQEALQGEAPGGIVWEGQPSAPLFAEESELPTPPGGWWRWRQREGALNRVPRGFYPRVWELMEHCHGLVIGDKLERRNRLPSERILAHTTAGEMNFALRIEHLLNKIGSPEYRQLTVEALEALWRVVDANPQLRVDGDLVLDVIVGHAVRVNWLRRHGGDPQRYDADKASAWAAFYELSPRRTAGFLVQAFRYLLEAGSAERPEAEAEAERLSA